MGMTNLEPRIRSMTERQGEYNRKGNTMANVGIKELKEALVYGFAVAGAIIAEGKDGFQPADLGKVIDKLLSDAYVVQLKAAIEGAASIPGEVAEVDLWEGIELGRFVLAEVKKLSV